MQKAGGRSVVPYVRTGLSLAAENWQTDAGLKGEIRFPSPEDQKQDCQSYQSVPSLLKVMTAHPDLLPVLFCPQVNPRISPFYVWFTVVTLFLIAAAATEFMPFSLPIPWTGICVITLVLLVSVVPMLYGRVYIKDAMVAFSRNPFNDGGDDSNDEGGNASNVMEGDIFRGEISPLLGSRNGQDVENRTWKQCLVVRVPRDGFISTFIFFLRTRNKHPIVSFMHSLNT